MNTSPTPRSLSVWLLAAFLGLALTLAPASASIDSDHSLTSLTVEGPDSLAESIEAPGISVYSTSQCGAGYFCVWSEPYYEGTIKRFSNQSQYTSIGLGYIGSFYNNRSTRVFVYGNSSGTPSACYGARAKKATITNWVSSAKGTYLSTATSC